MQVFNDRKPLTKLFLPVALLSAVIAGIVGLAWHDLDGLATDAAEIADVRAARRGLAAELGMAVNTVSILDKNIVMETREEQLRTYEARYTKAEATEEVGTQVGQIQAATREAVAAIQGIGAAVGELSGISAGIAAAVEEQGAATSEIARNVQQAASGTGEVSGSVGSIGRAATETETAAGQVLGAAGELSHQAERLTAEVHGFVAGVKAA